VLQQAPSTQKPDAHWLPERQAPPGDFFAVQLPPSQKLPDVQSASAVHDVLQMAPPHVYGAHDVAAPPMHEPVPLHVLAAVWLPWVHAPAPHVVPAA
jgi:hypothetical protein